MLEPTRLLALEQALAEHGLPLNRLRERTCALAFFGSRALGCERASSDWDLLCIGTGRSSKLAHLDLVWVDPRMLEHEVWLGGELAGHVAAYGQWLHGACSWKGVDVRFDIAARRKEERIVKKLRSLERVWDLLGPAYRDNHAMLLRREAQRLDLLGRGDAVPPTAHLDRTWGGKDRDQEWLRKVLTMFGAPPWFAEAMVQHSHGRRSTLSTLAQR